MNPRVVAASPSAVYSVRLAQIRHLQFTIQRSGLDKKKSKLERGNDAQE
jgi:hypothetical protein